MFSVRVEVYAADMCCIVCVCGRVCRYCLSCIFFFQAEDGIRDLVRSRGLGDVYKRQVEDSSGRKLLQVLLPQLLGPQGAPHSWRLHDYKAVSYTHLTLPTSDLV